MECKSRLLLATVLVLLLVSGQRAQTDGCPTWFVLNDHTCECGDPIDIAVKCDRYHNQSLLSLDFCMTWDEPSNATLVGVCPYNNHISDVDLLYVKLPKDVGDLNEFMCGALNRTGPLCSQCRDGLGPAVFSYSWQCEECMMNPYGWMLYIALAILPTTLFFLIIILFQIRITSASMNAFIFACQFIVSTINMTPYGYQNISIASWYVVKIMLTIYGIWNLDFFRYILPSFCVSSSFSSVHVLSLEYIIAIYPLLLILATYICIELHDRGCRVLLCLSMPPRWCISRLKLKCDPKASIIHTFAAFLLLSYSKLLLTSFTLLRPTLLYNNKGEVIRSTVAYDASVQYFSRQHLPFALLASSVLLVFIAIPLAILLLYPTKFFQKSLNCCGVRWQALHAFADVFQGCYKNGTGEHRDYRYFAGLYLMLRIIMLTPKLLLSSKYGQLVSTLCPITASLLFALLRPYKNDRFNVLDSVSFGILSLINFWIMYDEFVSRVPLSIPQALAFLPLVYVTLHMGYSVKLHIRLLNCCPCIGKCSSQNRSTDLESGLGESDLDLPDRIHNPEQYEPLLTSTSVHTIPSTGDVDPTQEGTYPQCGNSQQQYPTYGST